MPEAADRICCDLSGHGGTCLRVDPECKLLTQTATVVAVGMLYHGERAATNLNLDQAEALNRAMRWHAYRNFILWWWGSLGRVNRQRMPSCVLWAIRDAFPSPTGQYVGFRDVLQGL
ncbi:P2X purinoceptor 7-like [Amphibalanus amphitrite]|uniref:P2X purinoceptor 7-like n=1 Tax=Amphibalanus amphitrite TaxID=1232801 RepID=UPI001C90F0C5|nr:P2X purinoceptor 7-like [Amphibalanus amphitrite]